MERTVRRRAGDGEAALTALSARVGGNRDGPCNQGVNGDYWSSSIYPKDPSCVWYYNFDKYNLVLLEYAARYDGRVIRPVKSK